MRDEEDTSFPRNSRSGMLIGWCDIFVFTEVPVAERSGRNHIPYLPNEVRVRNSALPFVWFRISGFGFRVSGFRFRVSGFGWQFSGLGFRDSGSDLGFRVSTGRYRREATATLLMM